MQEDDNVELQGNGNLEAQQPNSASGKPVPLAQQRTQNGSCGAVGMANSLNLQILRLITSESNTKIFAP